MTNNSISFLPAKTALKLSAALLFLVGAPAAFSLGYSTTFDDFTAGGTLSGDSGTSEGLGAPTWDTNDDRNPTATNPLVGQADYVGVVPNYTPATNPGDYLGLLGGSFKPTLVPGSNTVYLYRPVDVSTGSGGTGALAFNVDFAITSNSTYPTRDTFGWTLQNSAGANLLSVRFSPNITFLNKFNISIVSSSGVVSNLAVVSDSVYHLALNVESNGTADLSITDSANITTSIFDNTNVSGSGIAPGQVTRVSATWILTDTTTGANSAKTGSGGNAMLFNNYSVIPEPSSVALGMAGFAGLVAMSRRRMRLNK